MSGPFTVAIPMPARVEHVERAIASLLERLEKDTGDRVVGVRVENFDVTTLSDSGPRHRRVVRIDLQPVPGSDWQT